MKYKNFKKSIALLLTFAIVFGVTNTVDLNSSASGGTINLATGVYFIKSVRSGHFMDVFNANTGNGTQIIQHLFNGNGNQRWQVTNLGNGQHYIVPQHASGKRLDVNGQGTGNGTKVQIWQNENINGQKFRLLSTGISNTYEIQPVYSNTHVLDVESISHTAGAKVQLWQRNNGDNQKWEFIPANTAETQTWNLTGGWNVPRGQTMSGSVQFYVRPGDTVRINVSFPTNANFDFGFINRGTGQIVRWSNRTGGTFNVAWMTTENLMPLGIYSFWVRHNTTSAVSTALVSGSSGYEFAKRPDLAITHCFFTPPNTNIIADYRSAIAEFGPKFGIVFPTSPNISLTTGMRGHLCNTLDTAALCGSGMCICVGSCSTGLFSSGHNRGGRLLEADRVSSRFTLRIVSHAICHPQTSSGHGEMLGTAWRPNQHNPPRRDSTASLRSGVHLAFVIQHELSHNLGAPDHSTGVDCVMDSVRPAINVWCSSCATAIRNNKNSL